MPTAPAIYQTPVAPGFTGLYLQPKTILGSTPIYDPDPAPKLTIEGWATTRHGFWKTAYLYANPPAYGQPHPTFSGMGLVEFEIKLQSNGEYCESFEVYKSGTYGDTIGAAQQPSDEFSDQAASQDVQIQLHPNFLAASGTGSPADANSPWSQFWSNEAAAFVVGSVPSYLVGLNAYKAGNGLLTATQYFQTLASLTSNLAALLAQVGNIIDPPELTVWGTLPGESTTVNFGNSSQWLCVGIDIGLRGQWWFRKSQHLLSPGGAWPDKIYNSGSL